MPRELTTVALVVLGLLDEQPRHPYDVFQTLVERGDDRLVRVTPGAVYHAVERLERDGLVEAVGTERCGNRPERTTYRATAAGHAALRPALTSYLADDRPAYADFPVGLAHAPRLPADEVAAALTQRRGREAARLATLRARCDEVLALGLPRRFLLDGEREVALLEREVAWLDEVLRDLADGTLTWGGPPPDDFLAARQHHRTRTSAPARRPADRSTS
ncbi:PadR family transcriptional regulator [Cellulomonas dongxiuzhuiae]|uniref:PadR family transcriptional regulator n=1 Tax=Cellulomonas dongxiuzhuiae TaxID=2819979 RepID=A0ABX8GM15_9CELL|nr:PadR family transcriptional regulator [Cellulomonas dongxiuzhuiae]MBO3096532.1 PadR family transcriptional regulator [Cellulomonas dongxiuzhuiae]QWC16922.1 PadR family transcriptional regulator [Cellulomonas dongxiuzhuiae]